jgi:putative membrane protein
MTGKYSFKERIENGVVPVGILLAFLCIAVGLLNAGSMSY